MNFSEVAVCLMIGYPFQNCIFCAQHHRLGGPGRRDHPAVSRPNSELPVGQHVCQDFNRDWPRTFHDTTNIPTTLDPGPVLRLGPRRSFRNRNGPARPSAAGRTRPPGHSRGGASGRAPAGVRGDTDVDESAVAENALFRRIRQSTRCQQKKQLRLRLLSAVSRIRLHHSICERAR